MVIHRITGLNNAKIKYLKKLGEKKVRDKSSKFLVENLIIIHDAMQDGIKPISLFVTEEIIKTKDKRLMYILENLNECFVISKKINKSFSTLATPSGIAAVYKSQEKDINFNENILYLNSINDPGNLGTILRTALAFGITNSVVDETCVDIYNPKTISAARDAIFKINLAHDNNLKILNKIKKKMPVYATKIEKGINIRNIEKNKIFCIVLGNEANGVSEKILKKSDKFIKIDMSDEIESLNVAVAAGIIMHEIWDNNSKIKMTIQNAK